MTSEQSTNEPLVASETSSPDFFVAQTPEEIRVPEHKIDVSDKFRLDVYDWSHRLETLNTNSYPKRQAWVRRQDFIHILINLYQDGTPPRELYKLMAKVSSISN